MSSIGNVLESRFKLKENKTNIQTEVLAGVTTFATMSYVLASASCSYPLAMAPRFRA